jgi:hypothetical protein
MILPPEGSQPGTVYARHGRPFYPMGILNGLVIPKMDRQAPSSDYDETPVAFRRYVNTGKHDVQIWNGLRNRIASGWRFAYPGAGYLNVVRPEIPGQTRGNYMGSVSGATITGRGPFPWLSSDLFQWGPATQPSHPGGPGKIASPQYINPGTG